MPPHPELFLDYLKGRTNVAKTGQLSLHLENCFECELAFERFRESAAMAAVQPRPREGWLRRLARPVRPVMVPALVGIALAAGALGIVGFLSSASGRSSPSGTAPAKDPGTAAASEVRRALADLSSSDPALLADGSLAAHVEEILAGTMTPAERQSFYLGLGQTFGAKVEALLWALAAWEQDPAARSSAYDAVTPILTDQAALLVAARREVEAGTPQTFLLLRPLARSPDAASRGALRAWVSDPSRTTEWQVRILSGVYSTLRGDPIVEARMTAALADPSEAVRSSAATVGADAKNEAVRPVAIALLDSSDAAIRSSAALAIARIGDQADVDRLFGLPWTRDQGLRGTLESIVRGRRLAVPRDI